ncbi:FAD binding domain-containing protein [Pseudonocardia sp.]|uniref:FAD binding domain-containing protein n=1 Tax=Pseudonocardia sp. TaxID=60912 RepID=UPI003D1097F8
MSRYAAARTAAEAVDLLGADPGARVIAGGTDLVVAARNGKQPLPGSLVAVHRIAELARQRDAEAELELGALTTHAWLECSPRVRTRWSALADAAAMIGSPATRATGTVGGNLMNASPAMDLGSPLLVLGAEVELRSGRGTRTLPVAELLAGPGRTTAAPDELLTIVRVPGPPSRSGSAYVRLEHRKAMEIAIVGAAAAVRLRPDGLVGSALLALTAVAPTCLRVPHAEALLIGRRADAETFAEAATVAAAAVAPITDVRAGAAYRRAMTSVVVTRALALATARAVRPPTETGRNP